MEYPQVTVLIPIRNVAKYIEECLDALLNQTYPSDRFEVWLLDNYSDDGTLEIVEKYPKNRVRVIQSGVHLPPIKYNKIIPEVKSEIIGFVDGDANVDKYWLEKVVEFIGDSKVAGVSGVILTQNKNKLVPRVIGYEIQDRYERMPREITRVANMNVVYKKSALEKIGGFNESLKTGYDCEIGYRIKDAGYKILYIPEAKVYHNHRDNLGDFFKQQYEYGKFAVPRYLKRPKILKGDNVTSFWMISQPLFYLASVLLFFSFFIFKTPFWLVILPLVILFLSYFYSAGRLMLKFRDVSAIVLIAIYIIRVWGWSLGASEAVLSIIKNKIID
ncbi:MAG: hypothetical protein A2174_02305 [Candidatus Portnoybacteria bacterium RBG_13_41_18]|uniref:Glycosyltransferase 2-like domain-containing protein n=1 Tax=Candidatus Portnoybacteria bacterium RBG_13_41_18 TaxID=1801991 RepID=A0A1G2F9K4_9BACT|nr:MAG: hypothetical protein A2174_02305 [Candidatus Portnoybacteria bacterium RBG_13_41_18]